MNNVNIEDSNIFSNLNPWFPLAALMLISSPDNSNMKELLDIVAKNEDIDTNEFQKWLSSKIDELVKQNGSDLNKWIEQIKSEYPGTLPEQELTI